MEIGGFVVASYLAAIRGFSIEVEEQWIAQISSKLGFFPKGICELS